IMLLVSLGCVEESYDIETAFDWDIFLRSDSGIVRSGDRVVEWEDFYASSTLSAPYWRDNVFGDKGGLYFSSTEYLLGPSVPDTVADEGYIFLVVFGGGSNATYISFSELLPVGGVNKFMRIRARGNATNSWFHSFQLINASIAENNSVDPVLQSFSYE